MAEVIKMPRLSDTMEEGVVATWLKKVGDKVSEGEILAEIETDKATMEFESFYDGILLHIEIEEGVPASVDSLLCIIGEEGEDISQFLIPVNESVKTTSNHNQLDLVDQINEQENIGDADNTLTPLILDETDYATNESTNIDYVTMPRLSDTMEEGTISSWLKDVGEKVSEGEILAEIETDKATMEFESFYDGILSHIAVQTGETVKVDELIAIISDGEIDVNKALEKYSKDSIEPSIEIKSELENIVEDNNSIEVDTSPELSISDQRIFASPLAKKIANEKNIDLSQITGSGENGRIVKEDLENIDISNKASSEKSKEPAPISQPKQDLAAAKPIFNDGEEFTEIENSSMRKAIAKNLSKSKFSAPHYYLSVEFNMDNAIAFREQYNSMPNTKISFNDIIIKACAISLKSHPQVNSQWSDNKIRLNNIVNIGVAVGIEDGLVVPVIKNADLESLHNINSTVRDYAVRAKSKKLRPDEIEGSTFTISNLGMFGIQEFTSIINQPNSAILSVGAIVKKPIVVNEKVVVGNTMKLTLACDHRSVDGVTGSLFLQTLKGYIENPVTILV
jgi:pyruvate dehydrogenase E2 component (dihydrolipoamide acetyltransferase)